MDLLLAITVMYLAVLLGNLESLVSQGSLSIIITTGGLSVFIPA